MTIELFIAAANGRRDDVESILLSGITDINFRGHGGMTALHAATKFKHHEVIRLLLQHGADPAIEDSLGETAMSLQEYH